MMLPLDHTLGTGGSLKVAAVSLEGGEREPRNTSVSRGGPRGLQPGEANTASGGPEQVIYYQVAGGVEQGPPGSPCLQVWVVWTHAHGCFRFEKSFRRTSVSFILFSLRGNRPHVLTVLSFYRPVRDFLLLPFSMCTGPLHWETPLRPSGHSVWAGHAPESLESFVVGRQNS